MTPLFKALLASLSTLFVIAVLALMATSAHAQEYPLKTARPKPLTATLVGVCEDHKPALMVAVFTYPDGHVLVADVKHMQGFESAGEIVQYAATAVSVNEYAQVCGVAHSTEGEATL